MITLQKGLFKGKGRLTQRFGANPQAYARFGLKGHNGIDYGIPTGTELYSCINGKVTEIANDVRGYGKYVKVENGKCGVIYAHLNTWKVKVGQQVVAGQLLGLSNNTGNSTGPHLHFGVFPKPRNRKNGFVGYIDPLDKKLVKWVDKIDDNTGTSGDKPKYVEFSPTKKLPDSFYKINEFKKLKDRKIVKGDEAFDTLMSILLTTDEDRNKAIAELEEQKKHFDDEVKALNNTRKQLLREQKEAFDSEISSYEEKIKELEEKLSSYPNNMANKKDVGKKWYASKTIWIAVVGALTSIAIAIQSQYPEVAVVGIVVSVLQVANRFLTDQPVQKNLR